MQQELYQQHHSRNYGYHAWEYDVPCLKDNG
jgi:hypothetical protein